MMTQPTPDWKQGAPHTAKDLKRRILSKGDLVFAEGDVADVGYLIVSGEIELFRQGKNGVIGVAVIGRGEILGEMSLIDGHARAASARSIGDSELMVIRPADLEKRLENLADADPVLRRLIDVYVARLRGKLEHLV